ncbi:MAG: riboflavin biosynthesis protein RibF [Kiritimatiellae bacterium]|nr:riboflavin biosynthesis protein RibF [Kiritimatiellia bacterium]
MRILRDRTAFSAVPRPVFLAAGFFDGVHVGHRAVLEAAKSRARAVGGTVWALTFDRHPLSLLAPEKAPPLLFPLEERLRQLEAAGLDGVLLLAFTRDLAQESPETFLASLAAPGTPSPGRPLSEICCGANWRFGSRASGTPALLASIGHRFGFGVAVIPYARYRDGEVSSTRIRRAVCEGCLEEANAMLGSPFSVCGEVLRGRGVGGRVLSFATANLDATPHPVLPPAGVYATEVALPDGTRRPGVTDIGVHPTFGAAEAPVIETHLPGFTGDLYGTNIRLSFLARLRAEKTFSSPDALARQIRQDIADAERIFARA